MLQFAKFRLVEGPGRPLAGSDRQSAGAAPGAARPSTRSSTRSQPGRATDLDELAASCPVPADASQVAAVGEATAGRTFVLEGPPGTGKSQTITNLLARAIADGRRVLFVAEKRAALDVVTRRLDAIGLGPFCLDLHDKSSKPTVVRAPDPGGAGPPGGGRRAGSRRHRARICGRRAGSSPATQPDCTNRTAPGCRSIPPAPRCCRSATASTRCRFPLHCWMFREPRRWPGCAGR